MKITIRILAGVGVALAAAALACGPNTSIGRLLATDTPVPTSTQQPTDTPRPTSTPSPTSTNIPAATATLKVADTPSGGGEGEAFYYENEQLGIGLIVPGGWDVEEYPDYENFEVYQLDGDGYADIYLLTEANSAEWEIDYVAGDDALTIVNAMLDSVSASDPETFAQMVIDEPFPFLTLDAEAYFVGIWSEEEAYGILLVVAAYPDRAIMAFCDYYDADYFASDLFYIYMSILESIEDI